MLRLLKVATPVTAATGVVPDSAAPAFPVPPVIATPTLPVNVGSTLPKASCAATLTAGVIVAPATVAPGDTVNASLVAVPGVMLNAVLTPAVSAPDVALRV